MSELIYTRSRSVTENTTCVVLGERSRVETYQSVPRPFPGSLGRSKSVKGLRQPVFRFSWHLFYTAFFLLYKELHGSTLSGWASRVGTVRQGGTSSASRTFSRSHPFPATEWWVRPSLFRPPPTLPLVFSVYHISSTDLWISVLGLWHPFHPNETLSLCKPYLFPLKYGTGHLNSLSKRVYHPDRLLYLLKFVETCLNTLCQYM